MKILFIGNNKTERCGVAEYGRHCFRALVKNGHEVYDWDLRKDSIPEHRPYDVVFCNWHAGTIGSLELRALTEPYRPKVVSAYLHESSPAWNKPQHRPPLLDRVDVAFVDHPDVEGPSTVVFLRTPVWDVEPRYGSAGGAVRIGTTGIRQEGVAELAQIAKRHGWYLSGSPREWIPAQDEVTRLAGCWINVAWYGAGYGGQASAMGALIAAGQPILINSNRMLETWHEFAEYHVPPYRSAVQPQLYLSDDLEAGLLKILADIRDGIARRPTWLQRTYSWPRQAELMVEAWEKRL